MSMFSLTFALDPEKRLVHVDDVANGIACGCTCPGCGDRLIARQGRVMAHHFAHESGAECATACESALHLAAKAILARERRIVVPGLTITAEALDAQNRPHSAKAFLPYATVTLDVVDEEVWMDGTRPDIVAKTGSKTLLIEIAVTHSAGEEKVRRLTAKGLPALEIDLSDIDQITDWASTTVAVIDKIENKRWLFNPKMEALKKRALLDAQALADKADREAIAFRERVDLSHEYQRASVPGFRAELERLQEFIDPANQATLRAQIQPDGESEDAWQAAVQDLGAEWDDPPPHLNVSVPGELMFLVDRRVWQAGIFITFIRRYTHKSFSSDEVVRWTYKCFERRASFPALAKNSHLLNGDTLKAYKVFTNPVSKYLGALKDMGFITTTKTRYISDSIRWRILKWG